MASLDVIKRAAERDFSARDIAGKREAEGEKESTLSGILSLLKPVAAGASKFGMTALAPFIGITNPYLLPLLIGGGTAGISKLFDFIGRDVVGAGGDFEKIKSSSKYGTGKDYASTLSSGLLESIKERDPFSAGNIGKDVALSYVDALTPKINLKGEKTGGELSVRAKKDFSELVKNFGFEQGGRVPLKYEEGGGPVGVESISKQLEDRSITLEDFTDLFTKQWGDTTDESYEQMKSYYEPESYSEWENNPEIQEDLMNRASEYMNELQEHLYRKESRKDAPPMAYGIKDLEKEKGIMALLQRLIPGGKTGMKEYAGGGMVQGGGGSPSIVDYFGGQGMTLGGSNTQSLAEILGRK